MPIYQTDRMIPVVPTESYTHPIAVLIGDVILGRGVCADPDTSLRGDFGRIVVKDGANIQDNCVMHEFPGQDTVMGKGGHTGHGAILHGCAIGYNTLVGMSAVIIDGVTIGENSVISASTSVEACAEMPTSYLIVGSPAEAIRMLTEQEIMWKKQGTRKCQVLVGHRQQTPAKVEPLATVELDRKRLGFNENLRPRSASQ